MAYAVCGCVLRVRPSLWGGSLCRGQVLAENWDSRQRQRTNIKMVGHMMWDTKLFLNVVAGGLLAKQKIIQWWSNLSHVVHGLGGVNTAGHWGRCHSRGCLLGHVNLDVYKGFQSKDKAIISSICVRSFWGLNRHLALQLANLQEAGGDAVCGCVLRVSRSESRMLRGIPNTTYDKTTHPAL